MWGEIEILKNIPHTICLKVFKENLWNNLYVSIWIDICRMAFSTLNNVGLNNPLLQISLLAKFLLVRAELYLVHAWGYANSREPWWVYVSHDPTNPLMYPLCFVNQYGMKSLNLFWNHVPSISLIRLDFVVCMMECMIVTFYEFTMLSFNLIIVYINFNFL